MKPTLPDVSHSPKGLLAIMRFCYQRLRLPLIVLVLLIVRSYGASHPAWVESWYSNGLYPIVRSLQTTISKSLPVPGLYLFGAGLLLLLLYKIWSWWRLRRNRRLMLQELLLDVLNIASLLIFWFLLSWGFNYVRLPMEDKLALDLQVPDSVALAQELTDVTALLVADRARLTQDTQAYIPATTFDRLARSCESELQKTLKGLDYFVADESLPVHLLPSGLLMHLQTSGLYWFFFGECNVDGGLHPLQMPFTVTHELAHGYGIAREGECNFLAYQACRTAQDPYIRYAGTLTYWRYVASAFRRIAPRGYTDLRDSILTPGIRNDLNAIYANNARFTPIMPRVRDQVYSAYLHAQTNEGLESYDKVVLFSLALDRKEGH